MSQQSRILAGVFCSGMAAALIAMAALQLPNCLQQRKMVSESPPVVQTAEPEQTPEPQVTVAPTVQPAVTPEPRDFTALLERNPEVIGWIKIDDTDVDLPVMQREGDNSYYLKHDLDGNWDDLGLPYLDYECDIQQSRHLILYGHNMADNTMFGSLRQYRQNPSYYKEAPFITFSSNYADYTYVMVGLIITSGNADSDFKYWQMEELDDKNTFDSYMGSVNAKNMIDNPIDVQYGDSLLTLSTCYSDEDNSRFVIVARRLRDGEDTASMLKTIQGSSSETAAAQE